MEFDNPAREPITQKRPPSVTLLAWLQMIQSLALLGFGLYLFFVHGPGSLGIELLSQYIPIALYHSMISSAYLTVLGIAGIVTSLALLRMRKWAWIVSMVLQGLGLIGGLVEYWRANPLYLGLAVGVFMVLLLNQHEVKITFNPPPPAETI
ncbi:MAG TPA: hypothetical protein VLS48_08290 [Anaerolineales bacterium]|nr:hypothetical protein [Anaerolineales bacterium]